MRNDWSLRDIAREWTRVQEDVERHATWILLAPLGERIAPAFVGSTVPDGLDSERLLSIGWSSTEEEMARAAVSLFHGGEVHLGRLARIGSDRQMMRLERALRVFRREVDPPEWDVDPDPMKKSSAHVRVDRIAYPGLNPGHYHHSRTVLPCGEQVLTRVGPPIVEILRDLVDTVENWSACDHRECRGEFAVAWSRMPKAGPLIHGRCVRQVATPGYCSECEPVRRMSNSWPLSWRSSSDSRGRVQPEFTNAAGCGPTRVTLLGSSSVVDQQGLPWEGLLFSDLEPNPYPGRD